jgi:hypothetical protein
MAVYTVATLSFYILGAAVLHRHGMALDDKSPMATLSRMYAETLGSSGPWVFAVGAFMVLYSTYFVSSASNSRLGIDFLGLLGALRFRDAEHRMGAIRIAVVVVPLLVLGIYLSVPKLVMLPFLAGAAIYFRHRRIPEGLRPGTAWTIFLYASFLAMTAVGVIQIRSEILKLVK